LKHLLIIFSISLFIQCASVNLIREPTTARDKEQIPNLAELQKKGFEIENKFAIVRSKSLLPDLKQYDNIIHSSTVELMDNLGGVEVIELRDFRKMMEEQKLVKNTKLNDAMLNQKLGTDAGIDELFSTETGMMKVAKYLDYFVITSRLNGTKWNVVYHPPTTYVDKKTGATRTTDPSWTMTVSAEINFSLMNSSGISVYSSTLANSYSKNFHENPPPGTSNLLLPKAIEYCFEDVKPELQGIFSVKTHIIAMKGDKKYAMIFGGISNKIRNKRIFDVLHNKIEVATLKIFQANHNDSWGKLSGDVDKVKVGSEVVLRPQKRSFWDKIWRFIEANFGL
jgi:hypothetical protein